MGLGMQIVYHGFAGSARLEAEAAIELIRLERFVAALGGCHLAIEALKARDGRPAGYDVRLDLVARDRTLRPVPHETDADPVAAIHRAFDAAVGILDGSPFA